MANYNWQLQEERDLAVRYSKLPDILGALAWRRGLELLVARDLTLNVPWLNDISRCRADNRRNCPRVFVSHRQSDAVLASRLAYLAQQEGFDYWLDVMDLPVEKTAQILRIEATLGRPLTVFEINVLQAAIIEMALINCTHVVALMTQRTAGSQWVPYEYGRVDRGGKACNPAVAYVHPDSAAIKGLPEYLYLAPIYEREKDFCDWLITEKKQFPDCRYREQYPDAWLGKIPEPF